MEVSRDTFQQADESTQNLLLFDSIQEVAKKLDSFNTGCHTRHSKLDKKVKRSGNINKAISAGSGLLGGFMAFTASKFFGINL